MMKSFVVLVVLVCVVSFVTARREGGPPGEGRERGPPRGGPRGPGGHRGPGGPGGPGGPAGILKMMGSSCSTFADAMKSKFRELRDSGEIGPEACQGGDHKECMKTDMQTVRCAVTEPVSPACIQEVTDFLNGDSCNESP